MNTCRAVAFTADTLVPSFALTSQTSFEEKVLDPASPGKGIVLTHVSPPSHPSSACLTLPTLPFEAQVIPPPGRFLAPPACWVSASGRCRLHAWDAGYVAFSPGVRLPTPCLSCALCRGGTGLGPEAGIPGAGTDLVQLYSQLLPLGHHLAQGLAQEESANTCLPHFTVPEFSSL